MVGDEHIPGAESPAAAAMRKDNDTARIKGESEDTLQSNFPSCDPYGVLVLGGHG